MNDFDAERRTGIGGSDAPAALGISPWRTPYDLYLEKIGEAAPLPVTEPMRWGTLLQPLITAEYCRRTGRVIEAEPPMLRHPEWPWMIGHIDGRVVGKPRILECKTSGISIGWGEEGTDNIPQHYLVQCYHYLILDRAEVCDVAVLIGGSDFRLYTIERDDEIADTLVEKEHAFWQLVEDRVPPDPVNVEDAVRRWGRHANPGAVVASELDADAVVELRQLRAELHALNARKESFELQLMRTLSERGDSLVDLAGTVLATWRLDNGRKAYSVAAAAPRRRLYVKD